MSHPAAALTALTSEVALAWTFEPAVVVPVAAAAALYLRGWSALRRRMPERFGPGRAAAFAAGLGVALLALCSPIDALGHRLLQAHMIQHLLLMIVAPPLLWLGAPVAPLLSGLPGPARRAVVSILATGPVRRLTRVLTDPRVAWVSFVVVFWAWHAPALYDLALRSDLWHHVEHACFVLAAMLFWHPVILAWPARRAWPRWGMVAYLLLAEAQATLLSAILTFSDRVIYPAYAATAGRPGMSPLDDQALAGVIMWVPGSIAFTIALLWIVLEALGPQPRVRARAAPATTTVTATNGSTATSAGQRS
jgi:cytochrome c oxidase assembly factor CtaG